MLLLACTLINACSDKEDKEPTDKEIAIRRSKVEARSMEFFGTFATEPRGSCADPSTLEVSVLKSSQPIFIKNVGNDKLYAQVRLYLHKKNPNSAPEDIRSQLYTLHYTEYFRGEDHSDTADYFKVIKGIYTIQSSNLILEKNGFAYSAYNGTQLAYTAQTSYAAPEFLGKSFIFTPGYTNIDENGKPLSDSCK